MKVVRVVLLVIRACLLRRATLAAENLALRQQLAVLQVSAKRPKLRKRDRVFWVWLSRLRSDGRAPRGSIRRECLRHVIIFNEAQLLRILAAYFAYYHEDRTHLSLNRNVPIPRTAEPQNHGRVIAIARVGGLHHHYARSVARLGFPTIDTSRRALLAGTPRAFAPRTLPLANFCSNLRDRTPRRCHFTPTLAAHNTADGIFGADRWRRQALVPPPAGMS